MAEGGEIVESEEARTALQDRIKEHRSKQNLAGLRVQRSEIELRRKKALTPEVVRYGQDMSYFERVSLIPDYLFSMIEAEVSADTILRVWDLFEDKTRRARGLEPETLEEKH